MTIESQQTRDELEKAAATWIARRDGETWTSEDAASLDAWLAQSPGHRVAYYRLRAIWIQAGRLRATRSPSRYRPLAVAAGVLLLLAGVIASFQMGFFGSSTEAVPAVAQTIEAPPAGDGPATADAPAVVPSPPAPAATFQQRYVTALGASQAISLPDGSRVTLDTDSRIRVAMDGRSRTVQLDHGQAYFEVAKDPLRPFVVRAAGLDVIAVGTAFSVRRVASEVRVVVAEGAVRLEGKGLLPAGGIARVEGATVQIHHAQPMEVERNLSWRGGVLTFRHTALSEAAAEFNRYGVRPIVIADPAIGALELGGVFRTNDVEGFVHLLERTFPISAALHPDRIELTARKTP
jgi:transmembrane sensor